MAYDWASRWRSTVAPELHAYAQITYSNASFANERAADAEAARDRAYDEAVLALGYRNTAGNSATTATTQAGLATNARQGAESAAGTATTQAGLANTARIGAEAALSAAGQQVTLANNARSGAEAARDTAVSVAAFGFTATSATSLTIGLGARTFAIEAGKSFVIGQYVSAASTADPSISMAGPVTAHDRAAGQLTLAINATSGAGTLASWQLGLAASGAAAGVQTIAAGTYADADLAPLNTVTIISAANSAFAAAHLPCVTANSASAGWGDTIDWVVETLGFGAGAAARAAQTATPGAASGAASGLHFVRRKTGATWGRWKPARVLPTSTLTVSGGHMYGDSTRGLNRLNVIAAALSGSAASWSIPTTPQDGDTFAVVTNARADNTVAVSDIAVAGNGFSLGTAGDTVLLNRANTRYDFFFNASTNTWGVV
ncbi:hypothetical protein [Acidovorax sp. NCPPB 4044]|uniref:hypothetical protein n=1 Tax=Acidovorax sp. NCPPB 4044 TaxID=2940490 RepID=UPI0023028387|nr:hypothetical protein [Acidovorax sp. NCPPB 4044]MDA8522304.1 hypothetical protein [Acidovorax sp. NCPPB 4044]